MDFRSDNHKHLTFNHQEVLESIMKKVLVLVSAVFMLAAVSTSCNKTGCHCYVKTDIMHLAPVYDDETSTKEECKAIEAQLNEEEGMNIYKCKQ
jgi:ABC-type phosphate/phosphonate transport system substrate-binding protein